MNSPLKTGNESNLKIFSNKLIVAGVLMFALLFGAGGSWAYFAKLSGAVIASGQVAVLGQPKVVQHLDGGIVAEIKIDNGSRVNAGDTLIRLDETILSANLKIYENRLIEAAMQRDRLIAERDGIDDISWDSELFDLLGIATDEKDKVSQSKLMAARRASRKGKTEQFEERIAQYENQIEGMKVQNASRIIQLGFMDEQLKGVRSLKEKGLVSNTQLMSLERQREEINSLISGNRTDLAQVHNGLNETQVQILQIDRTFQEQVLTELHDLDKEINELVQQYQITLEQKRRVVIKAPSSGIVHELSIFTIGGVIAPGETILQLIPVDQNFEVEAAIEPQFIDQLSMGQAATVRFTAFNQRSTPDFEATIRNISPSVVLDEHNGQSFYKIWLAISKEEQQKLGALRLIAGMPAEVFIKSNDRTPMSYILKPLADQFERAIKEE